MPPNLQTAPDLSQSSLPENQNGSSPSTNNSNNNNNKLRCAILGCGMMGQEHASYLMGYSKETSIDFLCDPHEPSLSKCRQVMVDFYKNGTDNNNENTNDNNNNGQFHPPTAPKLVQSEQELLSHVNEIDLLIIASPNHLHTEQLLKWSTYDHLTILCEKPVAVSQEQVDQLVAMKPKARIWVAMEYRFIPAVSKLLSLLPSVGEIKMVTIRENRYPFLHKIGAWNRDRAKTGDTLVEKCCHFFDLFRLITSQEASLSHVRSLAQRGLNYDTESYQYNVPIMDSAYVTIPFLPRNYSENSDAQQRKVHTIGCLELCMFAEGSRHQEEIIVTGTNGRLEAYLPENKVYQYQRPSHEQWSDRSIPPPKECRKETIYDCSNVRDVHGIDDEIPTHGGYHYSSTAVEWFRLLRALDTVKESGEWKPLVSLEDGIKAVEIGLHATRSIVNELPDGTPAL